MKYFSKVRITDGKMDETILARDTEAVHANNVKFASVLEYGAKGDNTSDDTDAIKRAVDTGLPVYFPIGMYKISQPITPAVNGQMLFGAGRNTKIVYSGDSAFNCNNLSGLYITNLEIIEDDPHRNAGYAIANMSGAHCSVHRVHISAYNGIEHGSNSGIVSDCTIGCVNNGIKIYNGDNTETVENCIITSYDWTENPDGGNGILVESGACANLKNVSTLLKGIGIKFTGAFSSFNAIQCWFDNCGTGFMFAKDSHAHRTRINNCWFAARSVCVNIDSNVDGLWLDNCEFYKTKTFGILANNNTTINNLNVTNCFFCADNGGDCINLYGGTATNIIVNSNNFSAYENSGNYSVGVSLNNNVTGIISGNCFKGVTTPVFGAGANITVANNAV